MLTKTGILQNDGPAGSKKSCTLIAEPTGIQCYKHVFAYTKFSFCVFDIMAEALVGSCYINAVYTIPFVLFQAIQWNIPTGNSHFNSCINKGRKFNKFFKLYILLSVFTSHE